MPKVAIAVGAFIAIVVMLFLQVAVRGESLGWAAGASAVTAVAFVAVAATLRATDER